MSERTEAPTARRLNEARMDGKVVRSQELNSAAALLIGAWLMGGPGRRLAADVGEILTQTISSLPTVDISGVWLREFVIGHVMRIAPSLSIVVLGMMATGILVTVSQTGLLWAKKRIGFDFNRINPIAGFRRLFSVQGLFEFGKALVKLLVVGWVAYSFLTSKGAEIIGLEQTDLRTAISLWAQHAYSLALRIGAVYLVLALLDYAYNRRQHKKSLLMTKEEVKEEFKQREGDPFIKRRIRARQRSMARLRMLSNIATADVVITNPTHLALAIQYDPETMSAPKLLAKGAYRIAERIIALANENRIPVLQNIPLARALYQSVEIDQEIPPDLYMAVAEILAYVFSLRSNAIRNRTNPSRRGEDVTFNESAIS